MKSGIRTSEFWVALLSALLAALLKAGVLPVDFPHEAFMVLAAYILSRGLAKLRAAG